MRKLWTFPWKLVKNFPSDSFQNISSRRSERQRPGSCSVVSDSKFFRLSVHPSFLPFSVKLYFFPPVSVCMCHTEYRLPPGTDVPQSLSRAVHLPQLSQQSLNCSPSAVFLAAVTMFHQSVWSQSAHTAGQTHYPYIVIVKKKKSTWLSTIVCFWHIPLGRGLGADSKLTGGIVQLIWLVKALGSPR